MSLGAVTVRGVPKYSDTVMATGWVRLQHVSTSLANNHWSTVGKVSSQKIIHVSAPLWLLSASRRPINNMGRGRHLSATDSNRIVTSESDRADRDAEISERSLPGNPISAAKPMMPLNTSTGNIQPDGSDSKETSSQMQEAANRLQPAAEAKQNNVSSSMKSMPKRSPLTAREKLRAARMLSKYTESKPAKAELGSKVLEALRESDGGKARSGLPQAPTNLFDDSKRGMPKPGWTFDFPGGYDLFIIIFSFVFISTVMFATTYIVWKVGAIHFNDY